MKMGIQMIISLGSIRHLVGLGSPGAVKSNTNGFQSGSPTDMYLDVSWGKKPLYTVQFDFGGFWSLQIQSHPPKNTLLGQVHLQRVYLLLTAHSEVQQLRRYSSRTGAASFVAGRSRFCCNCIMSICSNFQQYFSVFSLPICLLAAIIQKANTISAILMKSAKFALLLLPQRHI